MSERVQVNPELPPSRVPARVLNEMRGHALETHPEECCGLLVGRGPDRFREAHRCRNEMTRLHRQDPEQHPRDGRAAFHMNEADTARILQLCDRRDLEVTGVYHSHVQAGAYFSELDQLHAREPYFPFPTAAHFVISVVDGTLREAGAFHWDAETGLFQGRAVVAEAP